MDYYDKYYIGYLWLPSREEHRFQVSIYIDNNGNSRITSFEPIIYSEFEIHKSSTQKIDCLFGHISDFDGKKKFSIKIYNMYFNGSNTSLGHHYFNIYRYYTKKVFVSKELDLNVEENLFEYIQLNSESFFNWINISGITHNETDEEKFGLKINYNQPDEIPLFESNELKIYFYFRANYQWTNKKDFNLKEKPYLNIKAKVGKSIQDLFDIRKSIDRLMSIILDEPFLSSNVEISSKSRVNYKFLNIVDNTLHGLNLPLKFELFVEKSADIFTKWYEKQDRLNLILINYFSVYGQKGVMFENRFLTYASILENYHKNISNSNITTLKCIFQKYIFQSSISKLVLNIERTSIVFNKTRQYHAHLEEKHEKKILNPIEINDANLILEFIIREILLTELGVSDGIDISDELKQSISKINKIVDSKPLD